MIFSLPPLIAVFGGDTVKKPLQINSMTNVLIISYLPFGLELQQRHFWKDISEFSPQIFSLPPLIAVCGGV